MGTNERAARAMLVNVMSVYYSELKNQHENLDTGIAVTPSEQASLEMITLAIILRALDE